jgi:NitT/TauT family transport system ATP-binding protein
MSRNNVLDIRNVHQWFGDNRVLHDVNLRITQGQFVALVGPSGCGKSTLLRAVLGTVLQKKGEIVTDDEVVRGPNRNVGIVYQRYGLYPWLTAEQNVAIGPQLNQSEIWERLFKPWWWRPLRQRHLVESREILVKFKLGQSLQHYPYELSGGMQQRVAIAQALIMKPKILLLDEPFGALDEATREELQEMLLSLYQENISAREAGLDPPWTIVIITHELNEAFYVSDRIIGLSRNWYSDQEDGKRVYGKDLGATKVWDKCSPVFHPDEPRDFSRFHSMKEELRRVVLESVDGMIHCDTHVSYWDELKNSAGSGVANTSIPT